MTQGVADETWDPSLSFDRISRALLVIAAVALIIYIPAVGYAVYILFNSM
jgi:hypothetical protein